MELFDVKFAPGAEMWSPLSTFLSFAGYNFISISLWRKAETKDLKGYWSSSGIDD